MKTLLRIVMLTCCLWAVVSPAQATDSAKERRWATQVTDFLLDGEPVWLEAAGHRFLGIYTPSMMKQTKGAVILVHGGGVHPDWPQVIQPLRTKLPAAGWATLSLQMPVLPNEAREEDYVPLFKEVPERMMAGIGFLASKNISDIFLIGHSLGASMAGQYLAGHGDAGIRGFVGIGMNGQPRPAGQLELDAVNALLQMRIPVLDIYGSKTNSYILESVGRRAYVVYHNGSDHSRQIKINGADHFFQGYEDQLLEEITGWLAEIGADQNP